MVGRMEERSWMEERHCLGGGRVKKETGTGAPGLLKGSSPPYTRED